MRPLPGTRAESVGRSCRCDTGGGQPGGKQGDGDHECAGRRTAAGRCGDRSGISSCGVTLF